MAIAEDLLSFKDFGRATRRAVTSVHAGDRAVMVDAYVNAFWTAKQRAAHSLHEVSYRACFKPQLPRFFIERLTAPGDVVYDPFMGRGTTLLEAALLGRVPAGCDVNPLSRVLVGPRLRPPSLDEVRDRLASLDLSAGEPVPEELLAFYHSDTLRQLAALRRRFLERDGALDRTDAWIRMVAVNRLTGHSAGFFSVYTLPPNQAVSVASQRKINRDRGQVPPRRDVRALILKKTRALLSDCGTDDREALARAETGTLLLTSPSERTPGLETGSVSLVVTSPPFLDVVDYATDNWLRCWFCGIDPAKVSLTVPKGLSAWEEAMTAVFRELARVVRKGGHVAFEVGEVKGGRIKLEESALRSGLAAGLTPILVLINDQAFTKTAHCWGVDNNSKGTNTNRIVLFRSG